MVVAIEWDRIGQPRFDRIVEALVHRLYDATATVEVVNGRGGDGGIDIRVTSGGRVRIVQLKYYPDGFPTSIKGRRASIKQSFARAMGHDLYEWILVVPCTLSTSERDFVKGLAAGRSVKIKIMDRAELDDRLAVHSDLEASFTRDQLMEAAKVYNQEKALLCGGARDLAERVAALGGQVDDLDDHWTVDFSRRGNTVIHTLRGKHPRAHEVSPVHIKVTSRSGLDPDLAAAMRRTLGFGLAEEVVLPPEVVESLTITGPDWLAGTVSDAEVRWRPAGPAPRAGAAAEILLLDEHKKVTASYSGLLNGLGRGSIGRSVDVELPGGTLRLMIPRDTSAPATLRLTFSLGKLDPASALRNLGLQQRLLAGGAFEVRADGKSVGGGHLLPAPAGERERAAQLRLYVEDLQVLQQHCEQYFPVPADLPAHERIGLRIARLLIEGHCVISPFVPVLTFTLNGNDSHGLRAALAGGPQSVSATVGEFAVSLAGRTLDLGPVLVFHPRAASENSHHALHALDTGHADGTQVDVRPADGEYYRLYLQSSPDHQPVVPVPLGLNGYPEPR